MTKRASERLVWAVEAMGITGDERLLEIGCGHGVAVSLVCEQLRGGSIVALDRSEKMIAAATKRNAEYVATRKASFVTATLRDAELGAARFDKIFAIRVGAFLQEEAGGNLEIVKRHLTEDGRFYLIYDPPQASQVEGVVTRASAALERAGFRILEVAHKRLTTSEVVSIVTKAL